METVKADNYKRVRLPDAKPGQVFVYVDNGNGSITLTPVKPGETESPKFKLVKEQGFTVIETDRHVSLETIKELLSEFP